MDLVQSQSRQSKAMVGSVVFGHSPALVYWEATLACELSCAHCRAGAQSFRHPDELSTDQVKNLLDQIADFPEVPRLIITGGDPLLRPDLLEIIEYGFDSGIDISITPAGTPRLTKEILSKLKSAGISGMALSLDGSTADRHDSLRRVHGSFNWTKQGCKAACELCMPVQINTLVSKQTLNDIPAIYEELLEWNISRWALFFLIPTGRGAYLEEVSPIESERFINYVWRLQQSAPFQIKTTEAHHVRRIAFQKASNRGLNFEHILNAPFGRGFGIRDGNGIIFVSFRGDVSPSGFLPKYVGNVSQSSIIEIYQNNSLFCSLRDPGQLKGKCGFCEFRGICGGSRARAYAHTGDPLESDPLCMYQP